MKCKKCKKEMRRIEGQPAGVNIYQCDRCKIIDGESSLEILFG